MSVFGLMPVRLLARNFGKEIKINFGENIRRQSYSPASSLQSATVICRNFSGLQQRHNVMMALRHSARTLSIQEITKNMQLFTEKPRSVDKDPKSLRLKTPIEKPLVILLAWLLAKEKHLGKYAEIYIDQGFDVVSVSITPWQLLWPAKGSQFVAADLLKFLENNAVNNPLLLHGFSVGGYFWGEVMVHMARETDRYSSIMNRICGQVWDSAADITEIPVGVPKALFPKNPTLEKALRGYMLYHLKTFHDNATTHYIRSSQMFHSNMIKSPALFLLSQSDPVGAEASNQRVRESWESMGIQCTWKCWNKSPHVTHFQWHREEYLEALFSHLLTINMVKYPEKLRAKL